jgi:leucyl aminopeptidase
MVIKNEGKWDECSNRVLLVSESGVSSPIAKEHSAAVARFREQKKSIAQITNLEDSLFLVKVEDDAEGMRKLGAKVLGLLDKSVEELAISGDPEKSIVFTEGLLLASYQFLKYFKESTQKEKRYQLNTILLEKDVTSLQCEELLNTFRAVSWSRDMVNEPVSYLSAEQLSEEIKALSDDAPITVSVLEKTQLESLKMGGLLAVNQGSIDPPTFTIVEYKPEKYTNTKPIVLVGKGVVYDTGGLSLKPTPNSMDSMKSDMGGAACVAGAIYLAAKQKLPLHIIALIPATDNRPGLNAYAPGDVVTMFDGTTVEVLNTDAEGRMILADALAYSKKYDPELVIDAATLTGAAHRAVGEHAICIMGNAEERFFAQLNTSGESTYERVVRFPFWKEYGEEMKSSIADLKNLGGPTAGMITAGKFLEHFVKAPYIHMDIAGPAWRSSGRDYLPAGGTGAGVRLLYDFLKNYK